MIKKNFIITTFKTFFIFYFFFVFLYSCKSEYKTQKFNNKNDTIFICEQIKIPIFQTAQDVNEYCDKKKLMKTIMFKSNFAYPSTEIFNFYDTYLKNNGFKTVTPSKMTYQDREWVILESESNSKKKWNAHFKSFWQNIEKHQIWWLELESDISKIIEGNNETRSTLKQYVFITAKILYPMPPINEINIFHFYPEFLDNAIEKKEKMNKNKRAEQSFEGYYTLGEVQLRLRIVLSSYSKNNISEGFEKIHDFKGKLYFCSKETEISENDIDHLVVKKSDLKSGFDVEISLKDEFFKKKKNKLLELKGKRLGLFKDKEMILFVLVQTPFEKKMILIISDLLKLKKILNGMIKKE